MTIIGVGIDVAEIDSFWAALERTPGSAERVTPTRWVHLLATAVSELLTNAIRYAPGPCETRLRRIATEVICEVVDHDPRTRRFRPSLTKLRIPRPRRTAGVAWMRLSEGGRGLHIVHELTNGAWGFCSQASTKIAWFALDCPRGRSGPR